jgi:hypothetical protein
MPINTKNYQPVQALTVKATVDLPAFRFVSHLGSLCADSGRALGVTETDWVNGEYASVISLGTIAIETVTTIAAGVDVTSGPAGKARAVVSTEPVNGRTLDACTGSGIVRIKIVP